MRTKKALLVVKAALLGMVLVMEPAVAALYNPDFEQGLDGWTDLSSNGSVAINAGAASLTAGDGVSLFSAVLAQGDDGSFTFFIPILLSNLATSFEFDLLLLDNSADNTEAGGSIFGDFLTLSIYDAEDSAYDLIFSKLSYSHNSLDVSSLAGRNVAFSFELSDENNGFNLSLAVDNLNVVEQMPGASVPESSSMMLLLLGFSALVFARRKQNA